MDASVGDEASMPVASTRSESPAAASSPMKVASQLSDVPRTAQTRSVSAQDVVACDSTNDGPSHVLKNVRGFYQVKNEDDLLQCMEGLSALFSRAVELETDGGTPSTPVKPPKPHPSPARRPKTATPCALTPRSAQQKEYFDQAIEILNGPPRQLTQLLQTPAIQAAMNATGIVADEFQRKTIDDFTKEKNRAWLVPADIASLRFKHYEKTRKNNLALLLQVAADGVHDVDEACDSGVCDYSRELAHEHKLLEAMIKGRLKYEKILEKEAAKISKKRAQYLVVDNGVVLQRPGESESMALRQQMQAEKAEQNRVKMERVQRQRELLEATRQQNADARRRFEKSKHESSAREKEASAKDKRMRDDDRQKKRQQVLNDARANDVQRRKTIQAVLDDKEDALREKRVAIQHHNLIQKESKRLMVQEREANVWHLKNVQAFKRKQAARKIQANYRRIDNLNVSRLHAPPGAMSPVGGQASHRCGAESHPQTRQHPLQPLQRPERTDSPDSRTGRVQPPAPHAHERRHVEPAAEGTDRRPPPPCNPRTDQFLSTG
ncbi:hypothetical protein, variant 2 [Aphanomyces invadans]|uniref:Uncharacterized protein n=1 Tax=Aphanomyces invadans TaxID=157072 RepID=A0A024TC16_9STRA|nr:hypothetical protein, variant 2 [Aphanomyces invadans]ETV91588.1 hypothetical protein, variant 2 [Aphanomyces invadans]|eukprot:XP_008879856.1 hypothetical protein, variant 2 [Aphanomyces invadans]